MVQVVQVVKVVRMTNLDEIHSENIWFPGSNYRNKLKCHACNGRTEEKDGKWKVGQYSVRLEIAKAPFPEGIRRVEKEDIWSGKKRELPPTRIGSSKWSIESR